ncbi:hypothetical protein M9434_000886 [Picochlorum sp. BPE23]|nr:hypothetical protein M9434_000886 [Picochlorum sp. BPE23]
MPMRAIGRGMKNKKHACPVPWVRVDKLTPESLWDEYISQRRPIVIRGHPSEISSGTRKWTNEYLKDVAGKRFVSVEYKTNESEGFGLGKRRVMAFSEFLLRIEQGQENLYLTSPQQPLGPHGFPDVMVSPTLDLLKDFPVRLSLAGNLIPQQINLWMGNSKDGSSSGLHHDYHDNFYILLRGKKRFRLFPPHCFHTMYTHGELVSMHPNGRIVYKGQENILPDGSNADDVRQWKEGAQELASRSAECSSVDPPASNSPGDPPSFSRVDLRLPESEIMRKFKNFPFDECIECTLCAGDMLFLPAGWFHEVTSMNDAVALDRDDKPGHMALNYWLYPPDNLRAGEKGFRRPYMQEYWEDMWKSGKIRLGAPCSHNSVPSRKRKSKRKRISTLVTRFGRQWKWYYFRH